MTTAARIIGGPGAGKTTRLLQLMDLCLERDVRDPLRIGFVSFTRAARREASSRAADKFGLTASDLEQSGWFRTLHSICHRQLGIQKGELILGTTEDTEWLREAINDDAVRLPGAVNDDDDFFTSSSSPGGPGVALQLWDASRNRMEPLDGIWASHAKVSDFVPDLEYCEEVITLYESAKRRDGRSDFCDLLMRFSGKRWSGKHEAPFDDVEPEGGVPYLPVWIHDEAQDSSQLTNAVFRRLVQPSTWVYLAGDDRQAIYSWAGSDPSIFLDWPIANGKEDILPKSHRCSSNILSKAEEIIAGMSGYRKRNFEAARGGGDVRRCDIDEALADIQPGTDTLVLARTNDLAHRLAASLTDLGIPWKPTKGRGGFNSPSRVAGVSAMVKLSRGGKVDGLGVRNIFKLVPSKIDGTEMIHRGMKKWFDDDDHCRSLLEVSLTDLDVAGGTAALKELIGGKQYARLGREIADTATAAEKHGPEMILDPKVRVGTCHSSKGMEADHVVAMNQITQPTQRAIEEQKGMDEERRVWYVTATRARHKLTIAEGNGEMFEEL